MQIKTPKFWYRELNTPCTMLENILWPVSCLYAAGHKLNLARQTLYQSQVPVICIGNIVAGGSGKTPVLMAVKEIISKYNLAKNPFCLSRGYGGSEIGPHLVDPKQDTAENVGDEPLLLAAFAPTLISKNRRSGLSKAQNLGADLVLMDDGYQNKTIFKDISFLVIDGASGFGNQKLLPCGPLREPIEDGIARASAIILIGEDKRNVKTSIPPHMPVFQGKIKINFTGSKDKNYIAFCGIARPEKFQKSLRDENLNILSFYDFPDHHPFTIQSLDKLLTECEQKNAKLITTEKDFVRIPESYRKNIVTLPISIIFDDEVALADFIKRKLGQ